MMPQQARIVDTVWAEAPDVLEPSSVSRRFTAGALWAVAAAIVAGWFGLAFVHLHDDYRITHVQGVWIALAEATRAGQLYPPLFDGEHYTGTRYMPMPILLNALASDVTADPLSGGKLVAAGLMAALLILIVAVLRRFSCPWAIAAAVASAVVATEVGLQAGTSVGGDSLPVVLQVGALFAVVTGRSSRLMVAAGVLAGLAIASKLTALWGALAIATWLAAQRDWQRAGTFAAACGAASAIVLGTVEIVSGGGLSQHLLTFAFAGVGGGSVARAPNQVLYQLRTFAVGTVILLPLAILGAVLTGSWRRLSVVHFALAYAVLLLLVAYTDVGTGFNQLLDVVVLIALATGQLAGHAHIGAPRGGRILTLAIAISVVWAAGLDLVRTIGFDLRRTASGGDGSFRAAVAVAAMVRPGEQVFSEDPSVYVAMGRQPLIMDPFMLTRLDRRSPELVDPLIERIKNRQFGLVVMVVSLEDRQFDSWWSDYQLGPRVANALRESYRPERWLGRYLLYRPVQ
jgi:hypothetical protein